MKMRFKVTYDDGRILDAVAKPKDIVAFERQYQKSMADFANQDQAAPMEWLYYLAWSPLHRTRQDIRTFDEFLDTVDEIESVDEEPADEAAPFESAPSDAPSLDSPSEPV